MDLIAIILLLITYFIRPQDWVPGMAGMNLIRPIIALCIFGLLSRRRSRREPSFKLLTTPHEWVMVAYATYILVTSPNIGEATSELIPLVTFFFLTLHSLTSARRLGIFLKWWRVALTGVVIIGLGALYGFDFTHSKDVTIGNVDRLSLNSWLLNNPNALGHTLVTLFPLLYFGLFQGGGFFKKLTAILIAVGVVLCLLATQSKGAYLVGAGAILLCVILGRALWWKIAVLFVAIGMGGTLISKLPRMEEMSSLRTDEGVAGRLLAWQMARGVTRSTTTGEGWKQFAAAIEWEGEIIPKATHSAYVKVGADLGSPGLLLYLSVLCVAARSLFQFSGYDETTRRQHHMLVSLLACYAVSGWMIDRAYHSEFFILVGAIAAYHQLSRRHHSTDLSPREKSVQVTPSLAGSSSEYIPYRAARQMLPWRLRWRSYGLTDFIVAYLALESTYWAWDYITLAI